MRVRALSTDAATAQIAQDEHEVHTGIASYLEEQGFRDGAHANDTPERIAFPPVMEEGRELTERVRGAVQRLAQAEQQSELAIVDATAAVAVRAYGMFMLGLDDEAAALVRMSRVLDSDPLAAAAAGRTVQEEHHAALVILAAAINGIAHERMALQGDFEHANAALQSYARARAVHEQLRGSATTRAARTAPFVDEAERWAEMALYRSTLLTLRLHGKQQGLASLKAYQAKEARWPSTFRMPQRNVLRNLQATLLNESRTANGTAAAPNGMTAARVRTASTRRVHAALPTSAPSTAWSSEFVAIKRTATRTLEQTTSFPRADESNENAEKLAEQLVLSWRLDGAKGETGADEVVDLLYGLTRITFRSQTILRLLVQMLVAAEAYEEAAAIADKYMLIVKSTWQATGVPEGGHEMRGGRGVDSVAEYLDTMLLASHVELVYLNDTRASHTRVERLLRLTGLLQTGEQEGFSAVQASLPTVHVDNAQSARILRAAGTTAFALARDAPPSQRPAQQSAAIAQLADAVRLDGQAAESHFALAAAYAQAQDLTAALASARHALELEPASLDAWHLIVLLLSAQKDYSGALHLAEEALAQAESDEAADAHIPAAGAPSALTHLASYDYPPTARERGASYLRLLVTHNVLTELTEGVQAALDGQRELFEAFQTRLASVPLAGQRRDVPLAPAPHFEAQAPRVLTATPAEARKAYRDRVERGLLQSLWLVSAASFRRAGDLDQARDAIQEAEGLNSLHADLWVQLALWCLDAQKPGAAVTCLYKALACETDHVPASLHLARLLLQPDALHLRASHAETIAAVGTAQHGAELLTRQSLIDEGMRADHEAEARASSSLSLGARTAQGDVQNTSVAPAFAWKYDANLAPLSVAEGLLRTATLYRAHDVPEAWHLLAQLAQHTNRPTALQRKHLERALALERLRPLRPYAAALALP